jgi:hypothetical protein
MPCEDPELVRKLSENGRAVFLHINHHAQDETEKVVGQAMLHVFVEGQEKTIEAQPGLPGDKFDALVQEQLGCSLEQLHRADDGSRFGIGVAASNTLASIDDLTLKVSPGTPTLLGSFSFHDRLDGGAGDRMALFAFDEKTLSASTGSKLAERIERRPEGWFGPLEPLRAEAIEKFRALGDRTIESGELREVRWSEVAALASAAVFCRGERVGYWEERILPLTCLAGKAIEPVFEGEDLDELEDVDSVLHAMVEVLPYPAPPGGEGSLMHSFSDEEVAPLINMAAGGEYAGAVFRVDARRLLDNLRAMGGDWLPEAVSKFEHAWYRALRPGQPEGDAYKQWHHALVEQGEGDVDRCLGVATELRVAIELAAENGLSVALMFYEGA